MDRFEQRAVAQALLSAPGWARVGITDPKPSLRHDAAEELARHVLESVGDGGGDSEGGQPTLPL